MINYTCFSNHLGHLTIIYTSQQLINVFLLIFSGHQGRVYPDVDGLSLNPLEISILHQWIDLDPS